MVISLGSLPSPNAAIFMIKKTTLNKTGWENIANGRCNFILFIFKIGAWSQVRSMQAKV